LVVCHVNDINQVVLNIVVNAAHAIGDRLKGTDGRGTITVGTGHQGDHVVVSISDTGGGIPESIQSRIFDPFFTTKEVGRGTGQGLAIARAIVRDKHGGDLTFETRIGVGTTFLIRLPIAGKPRSA
jgi:signal transduction histidine kinase